MNLLVATDHFYPDIMGGSGRVAAELSSLLARKGHAVTIITRRWNPAHPEFEARDGMTVYRYTADATTPFRLIRSVRNAVELATRAAFPMSPPDAVHVHQPLSGAGLLPFIARRKVPVTYFFYSPWRLEYFLGRQAHEALSLPGFLHDQLRRSMERTLIRRAEKIVTLSRFSEEQLRREFRVRDQRVIVSGIGVNLTRFRPACEGEDSRAALGLPADRRILFTVRNLLPDMGVEDLLGAVARFRAEDPSLLLLIAGAGPLEPELRARADASDLAGAVRFLGFVDDARLPDYYRACDLFVLPNSQREGFGLVITEALACGTPAIGTPAGAIPEILHALDPRLLCASTGPESLYATMHNFFRLGIPRAEWSRRCRAYAESRFTWETLARDITT
ncbi:MAG: glycosyltransferase family 4 protein [Fibrobacterota bacterium]